MTGGFLMCHSTKDISSTPSPKPNTSQNKKRFKMNPKSLYLKSFRWFNICFLFSSFDLQILYAVKLNLKDRFPTSCEHYQDNDYTFLWNLVCIPMESCLLNSFIRMYWDTPIIGLLFG